jgi:hypothetical protein
MDDFERKKKITKIKVNSVDPCQINLKFEFPELARRLQHDYLDMGSFLHVWLDGNREKITTRIRTGDRSK